jgi:hypothetical protein
MFEHFYNEIFRSVIIAFGSLFNGIEIHKKDANDDTFSITKVPLAYGPTQKFLARLEQQADLNKPVQITLPRMSFEFIDLQYDPVRKATQTQAFHPVTDSGTKTKKVFMPVPYNMGFELSIMTKLNDDALQIVEQILPYFQPSYTLPIKLLGELKEVVNVPVQLESVTMVDDYEGNFDTRRALVYTLRFSAKTNLYGPISDVSSDVIRKVQVGYVSGKRTSSGQTYQRDVSYSVVPRATKNYTGNILTELAENVDATETIITVANGSSITAKEYITVGDEEMFVESIDGNNLTVKRGQDKTTAANHVLGAAVSGIQATDAGFIDIGDNFGFDGGLL